MNQDLNGSPAHETGNKQLVALEPHKFALPYDSDEFLWHQITPTIGHGEKGQPKTNAFDPKTADEQNFFFTKCISHS